MRRQRNAHKKQEWRKKPVEALSVMEQVKKFRTEYDAEMNELKQQHNLQHQNLKAPAEYKMEQKKAEEEQVLYEKLKAETEQSVAALKLKYKKDISQLERQLAEVEHQLTLLDIKRRSKYN